MITSSVCASGKTRGATESWRLEFAVSVFFGVRVVGVRYEMCSLCSGICSVQFVPFHKVFVELSKFRQCL